MSATLVAGPDVLADRYRLDLEVGRGGSGIVWSATDLLLGRRVAVKHVVAAPGADDDELRERTLEEARASAAVQNPHVVPVYDVVEDGGALWVVMEFVEARSLEEVVARDGALPPEQVAAIGLGVLDGLEAVHAAGLVHRDVKPGNVLLGADGRVLLADFGIATSGDPGVREGAAGDVVVGSPAYLAPERTRGGRGSRAADLWGLGATLATAVEGRAVFQRQGPLPTLLAVLNDEPDLRYAGPLAPLLRGLLAKDPLVRWDAARARAELERVRAGAVPALRAERAGRLALPGAALLVALVAAGLVAATPNGRPTDAPGTGAPRTSARSVRGAAGVGVTSTTRRAGPHTSAAGAAVATSTSRPGAGPTAASGAAVPSAVRSVPPAARSAVATPAASPAAASPAATPSASVPAASASAQVGAPSGGHAAHGRAGAHPAGGRGNGGGNGHGMQGKSAQGKSAQGKSAQGKSVHGKSPQGKGKGRG